MPTTHNVQSTSSGGVVPTDLHAAAAAQNLFQNGGQLMLILQAAGGGGFTATVKNRQSIEGSPGPDKVVAVAAGVKKVIGPLNPGIYNDANGYVEVDIDTPANVAVLHALVTPRFTS